MVVFCGIFFTSTYYLSTVTELNLLFFPLPLSVSVFSCTTWLVRTYIICIFFTSPSLVLVLGIIIWVNAHLFVLSAKVTHFIVWMNWSPSRDYSRSALGHSIPLHVQNFFNSIDAWRIAWMDFKHLVHTYFPWISWKYWLLPCFACCF